jgi:hypothetical protein
MLKVETGIPVAETRGRRPTEDHLKLLEMPCGASFVTSRFRETVYQIARRLKMRVRILRENEAAGTWRVWKLSEPGTYRFRKPKKKPLTEDQVYRATIRAQKRRDSGK